MATAVLLVAGVAWTAGALSGIALALVGVDGLVDVLPPLAIDDAAVGRTVLALSSAAALVGLGHLAVALGLRAQRSWAVSAGILLAAGAGMLAVALAAASLTSAAAGTIGVLGAIGATVGALLAAAAYALAGASLVRRLRLGGLR